jgi:tetratricopeptide (TPR) repeat protein
MEPLPAWTLPPGQERRLMVEAVVRFLANVAGTAGTLLVLDDLQWAGSDALDVLARLARSAGEVPLRVVAAYRDTEVRPGDPLSALLADLAAARLAARRHIGSLAPQEAARLLEELLDGTDGHAGVPRERVLRRAGGVPFFLISCAQAPGAGHDEGRAEESVPWDVGQSVRQRVAALPEPARHALGVAAVLGREVDPAILTAVVEHGEQVVLDALDAASHARLLVEEHDRYLFAHDVIREVVEADLGMARRKFLHRRIAEVLERQPDERPVELLAFHYERGGAQDKAVLYLEQAGDRAQAQYAHAAAESFYAAAVEVWERLGRSLEAARVRVKAAAALRLMARYDASQAALERAAAAFRAGGDHAQLIQVVAEIGRNYHYRGRHDEGLRWLEPQVTALETATTPEFPRLALASLYQALGTLYGTLGRCTEALAMTARSVDLIREVDAGTVLATALYRHAFSLMDIVGRIEDMQDAATEAARVAEAAGDLNALHWALHVLAHGHLIKGEWDLCRTRANRAIDVAEQRGDPGPLVDLVRARGMMAFYMGDWGQARRDFDRTQAISREIGPSYPYGGWPALLPMGRLALAEGQWELATRTSAEVVALTQEAGDTYAQREAQELLAELDLRAGRPQAAYARLAPVRDQPGIEERGVTPLRVLLAWAHLELGENEAAQTVVADALRRLRADDDRLGLVDAVRVQAQVQLGSGRWMEAAASLEEGLALAGAMPYPYGESRLLHVYGQLHARRGDIRAARERLEAALAIFRQLGARKDVERVEQLLTPLG